MKTENEKLLSKINVNLRPAEARVLFAYRAKKEKELQKPVSLSEIVRKMLREGIAREMEEEAAEQ